MDSPSAAFRFAVRSLRRTPAFSLVVVATIAVAIGATTTMLGVIHAAIVRPMPFRAADDLAFASGLDRRTQSTRGLSYREAADWRAMNHAFEDLAAYNSISLNLGGTDGDPQRVPAEIVSANFFNVLGASAERGRTFLAEEDRNADAHRVAVISHGLWQSRYGATDAIVGKQIVINGQTLSVVGVMPPGFGGLSFSADVWIPMMMVSTIRPVSALDDRSSRWLGTIGRLKTGMTLTDAQRDLDRVTAALEVAYPETNADRGARLVGLRARYLGSTRTLLLALFGAVGFLLLIACTNVMSLQLVRAAGRRREMALRVALGAGRRRLVNQLLAEGVVLAGVGAAAGILLATWGLDVLLGLAPAGLLPAYAHPSIDAWTLAWTTLIAIAAGIAFGLAPALARSNGNLVTSLKEGAPSAAAGLGSLRRVRAQQVLVVAEVALALVLVSGATLMVQSLRRQIGVDPGFKPDNVVAAQLALPLDRYDDAGRIRFTQQMVDRLRQMPGISAATIGADLPLRGNQSNGHLTFDGASDDYDVSFAQHRVTPEFFETLGIHLARGRLFTRADGPESPRVTIVSDLLARRLWPGRDPVGQRIRRVGTDARVSSIEVVGVVNDVRFRDLTTDLTAPSAMVDVYFPFAQATDETVEIAVRTDRDPASLAPELREVVRELDSTIPIFRVAPLRDALAQQTASARFGSLMLSLFAGIAVVLAAVGIYGLLAFVVGSSRRDIAIRMALGAAAGSVVALIVRKGMTLIAVGALLGVAIAVPSMRVLTSLLFDVRANDPGMLAGVAAMLMAVSLVACWLPARRASRIAPLAALKSD